MAKKVQPAPMKPAAAANPNEVPPLPTGPVQLVEAPVSETQPAEPDAVEHASEQPAPGEVIVGSVASGSILLELPFLPNAIGHVQRHINHPLPYGVAETYLRIARALHADGAKLSDGRSVENVEHAICYIGEMLRAEMESAATAPSAQ